MDVAALTEPMTVCLEAVQTAEVREGQTILVLGPGFIGQGIYRSKTWVILITIGRVTVKDGLGFPRASRGEDGHYAVVRTTSFLVRLH